MSNYTNLKAAIADVIKQNGNQEITGNLLQQVLLNIVSTVGANSAFVGVATPSTVPGSPDGNEFYIAFEPGLYSDFGGYTLTDKLVIFTNKSGAWVALPTIYNKAYIDSALGGIQSALEALDDELANKVSKTGDETINGIKDFVSSPLVPTPTQNGEAANKAYADTKVSKTDDEAIAGVKTFTSPPLVPTATAAGEAINKGQLDTAIAFKPTTTQGNVLFAGATNNIIGDSNLFWDNAQKFFGIGTNTPTAPIEIKTIASMESAPLGGELLTSSGWTTAGWTGDFVNGFTHTAGNTSILSVLPTLVNGGKYQVEVIVSNSTAGSFKINLGGAIGQINYYSNGSKTQGDTIVNNALPLEIVPTSDFDGKVIISLKPIIGTFSPCFVVKNSLGSSPIEMRSSPTNSNLSIGNGAGRFLTTGHSNTNTGNNAGYYLTTGYENANNGYAAGYSLATGYANTNNGAYAGFSLTTGYGNTNNGNAAGFSLTTGHSNTNNGVIAGYSLTTGHSNTNTGNAAGYSLTTGYLNTNIGGYAGYSLKTGYQNTNNGYAAGLNIGASIAATAIIAGFNYTIISVGTTDYTLIGAANNNVGTTFTATGAGAGTGIVAHNSNNNVAEGTDSGRYIANGTTALTIANSCTFIGSNTKAKVNGTTKEIVIGDSATGNGANTATIGDSTNTGTFFKSVYAELYAADNVTAQAIPTGATYTKINQFTTAGQTNASWVTASAANDNLVVLKQGRYKVEATASTKSGTANVLLKTAIFVGGVKAANIQAERKIINANDTSLISIGGIINVTAANTEIDVRVAHDNGGSVNITCVHSNLNLVYISE